MQTKNVCRPFSARTQFSRSSIRGGVCGMQLTLEFFCMDSKSDIPCCLLNHTIGDCGQNRWFFVSLAFFPVVAVERGAAMTKGEGGQARRGMQRNSPPGSSRRLQNALQPFYPDGQDRADVARESDFCGKTRCLSG